MAEVQVVRSPEARLDWSAAIWAGVIAGAAFMLVEMMLVALTGGTPWGPPRMIAAIVLGPDVAPPPATFDLAALMTAMAVHFIVSIVYAIVLALVLVRTSMSAGVAIGIGAAFGLVLYLVNFYGFTAIFPWFAMARGWVSIVSHLLFGALAGFTYVTMRKLETRPTPRGAA